MNQKDKKQIIIISVIIWIMVLIGILERLFRNLKNYHISFLIGIFSQISILIIYKFTSKKNES